MIKVRHSRMYLVLMVTVLFVAQLNAETLSLHREQWSGPRDGARILAIPVLRQTMSTLAQYPKASLLIRYPGGEDGIIWVSELEAWLVALGLESSRIEIRPGSPSADIIELEVIQTKTTY